MGGASAQVAYAPNGTETQRHAEDLMFLRLRSLDGEEKEYKVFVSTWLGYGANEARRRYIQELITQHKPSYDPVISDPCLPKDLELPIENSKSKFTLRGTGSLSQCIDLQTPLLAKDLDCHDDPCLFGGVHAPAIDFDVNHFVGVSEYWHTTHDVFDMGGTYDYATYSQKVQKFCARDWRSIQRDLKSGKWGKKLDEDKVQVLCFKAAWMMNVLHDGFGIPRLTREFTNPSAGHNTTTDLIDSARNHGFLDPFTSVDKIGGVEVSWTLGKMVLYSSSTIGRVVGPMESPEDIYHMVGFGPNNDDLYSQGEFYDPTGLVVSGGAAGALGHLKDIMGRRIPGLLLFFTTILVVIWIAIGKEGRNKVKDSTTRKWFKKRRKVMGASGIYERLEAGEVEEDVDDGIGGRQWALQELKPPTSRVATPVPSPRLDGTASSLFAVSNIGRNESRERLSRPVSRDESKGRHL